MITLPDPADADKITQWCKDYYEGVKPCAEGGSYINFMMEEGQGCVKAGYKGNCKRLSKIKAKYNPDNFSHINQNILPAS